jgi:hypothetical protein
LQGGNDVVLTDRNQIGRKTEETQPARKPWATPRVIVSQDAAYAEVKAPPTAEVSIIFSPTSHTPS